MTATDKLRHLLDEQGVEWTKPSENNELWTYWDGADGTSFIAAEDACNRVWVSGSVIPAQAVEVTLGRGTCHDVCQEVKYCFTCSECGHIRRFVPGWSNVTYDSQDEFNYCPNCGRKVIE